MLKVGFHTLGCKVNQYETEAIIQKFRDKGYKIVDFNEYADIYIVNTCTVTNMADKKSRQMLSKARSQNDQGIVVAVGCYTQALGSDQESPVDNIDLIIGTTKKNEIVEYVEDYLVNHHKLNLVEDISKKRDYEDLWMTDIHNKTRAYIKIQDGCNQFCTYCIIPYVRGRVRSRHPKQIISEVKELVLKGHKEIVLTGIHIASYGLEYESYSLVDLLRELEAIDGLLRIRLGSLEPQIINDSFMTAIKDISKLCPHFHLSLQSGSDTVLKRMNRKYSCEDFERSVRLLRDYFEDVAITTDIIVGFPGETEEEFNETLQLVEKIRFMDIHVFKYSIRKGTVAGKMKEQIPSKIRNKRSEKLSKLAHNLKIDYLGNNIKKKVYVLFEESVIISNEKYLTGYTDNYIKVYLKDIGKDMENQIIQVKICQIFEDGLLSNEI